MTSVRRDLPSGTVTFLFTDIEGSTKLLRELGADDYARALAEHRRILREAFAAHGGVEVDTQGDAFFVAFPTAPGALAAAADALERLAEGPVLVRVGIHTGTPHVAEEGYVGVDVHRAARIAAAGHGGQVLVSAATAALLDADGLRDLGEHRLKDLSAPERIYQLGVDDFPPLKSLHQTNLPIPATPFLGRDEELREVLELLSQEGVRLLTLTGPGGTGKTRLAVQAAAESADYYPHGVWWVPLAPLREPELVLETAAHALGAKDGLAEHIADKPTLVLFDNFEHVVDAAAGVSELLGSCPNLHVLVTSRELLRVPGEQAYPVPPLEAQDGLTLFLARAHAAQPGFVATDAVPELCARLENLPLALELAAARVRILSPEQLLERLVDRLDLFKGGRGVDARQQTLRATIEWSYDLLDTDEQRLFARLAVFAGGCTLETAEEVCDADLDTLQSLVDKSLVRVRDSQRFWMLETIREYAAERLKESGDADVLRERHAEHFLVLAEEAEPNLRGTPAEKEWLDRLEREHDNLRAALDLLESSGASERVQRLAAALAPFWVIKAHLAEGERRLESALRTEQRPTADRAALLHGLAMLAQIRGEDSAAARTYVEEALSIYGRLGTPHTGASLALHTLGLTVVEEGDYERARQLFDESFRTSRELGDDHFAMLAADSLAWACNELGDRERARALYEDNLRRARATSNRRIEAWSLDSLAMVAVEEGRVRQALAMLKESLPVYRELALLLDTADGFTCFAAALAKAGRAETATALLSRSLALYEELGSAVAFWIAKRNEKTLAGIRAQLDEAAFSEAWEHGRTLTVEEAVELALGAADRDG